MVQVYKWKEPPASHLYVSCWYPCIYSKIPSTRHARDRTGIGYYALSDGTYTGLEVIACNFLSVLLYLGHFQFFQCLLLEEVLHTFTKCHKQLQLVRLLFISWIIDDQTSYEIITSLWFLPHSSLLIISSFCGISKDAYFPCQQNLTYLSVDLLK